MTQRLRVIAMQRLLAMSAGSWLAIMDGDGVIDEGTLDLGMSVLTAGFFGRGRLGRCAFDGGWIRRGRLGGVGGVLVEALLEFSDLILQSLQSTLILLD
jgi:hypothetical protein